VNHFAAHAGPYALGTFRTGYREFAGLVVDGRVLPVDDAAGLTRPSVRELIEHWGAVAPELAMRAADRQVEGFDLATLEVCAPVEPRQIFQAGANYRSGVVDIAVADHTSNAQTTERLPTDSREPYVFTGAVSAVCGPYDDVILPADASKNDFEVELAAVIGRPTRRVVPEDALAHVMGYTIVDDITTRDRVWRRDVPGLGPDWFADWFRAKNSPTFLPTGPFLVPAEFVGDPMDLRLVLRRGGTVVLDDSTRNMIFDVARLVSYCSQISTLLPGDLVLTGSPNGNGDGNGLPDGRFLQPGDVIEAEITGLGVQRNGCVAEQSRRLAPPLRPTA
jgi:2-keto-4-pentenoate hydratase/2-oxohepta-3-ene-1,7-dioic acid hydratase in catechol pathway